ncbi:MAG: insulinase family protein [Pseudomonadota bacterium]|nr:MAG: insulinase family protein [Pseudomonadota bacterium]
MSMRARVFLPLCALLVGTTAVGSPLEIEHWTLANGARVYLVETRAIPMVQLRTVFDAGAVRDPQGRRGVALLTSAMLEEGTEKLSGDEIARRFETLGAEFGATAERDTATVDLRTLSDAKLLDPAIELYAQILASPNFPAASLERERGRMLVAVQRDAQSPGSVASKAFYRELYREHPYALDTQGDEASIKSISREDLVAHHKQYYVGKNAHLVIVGNVSKRQARKIAERVVGALPAGEAAAPIPGVPSLEEARDRNIDFAATQSHIFIGQPGMVRNDPDYFPLYVGNYILGGGGLVSRVSTEVREKRGLAYSAYSYFLPMRVAGPFILGLQTKNTQRQEAVALVRQVLKQFVEEGPTAEELEAAKKHITGAFPLRLDSNRKISDNLAVIAFYGLPLTWLDDYSKRVEAVTAEQIRDAFKRRVNPDRLVTLVVGGAR